MLYLSLAWRNIWRNKRRSFITLLSVVVAVLLAAVLRSMQEGQYSVMIENTAGAYTGYIQVHQQGYWDDQTLENSMVKSDSLDAVIGTIPGVVETVSRINAFALAASENQSRPAMVMGIETEAENRLSDPAGRIQEGAYFEHNSEQAVILGTDLMKRLEIQTGDSLVLIGQGFRGQSATGLYSVKGSVKMPSPELNKNLVLLPIETARYFLAADGRTTTLSLVLDHPGRISGIVENLRAKLPADQYEVMSWQEMMPDLVQSIQADRGSSIIIIMILYIVVGFGILGTVLMMITEREYEFGVMLSIGTQRFILVFILMIEILLIATVGALSGILVSIPVAWYFNVNPIRFTGEMAAVMESYGLEPYLPFSLDPSLFYNQAIIIFVITLLFSLIPLIKAGKLNPVNAMRH